MAQPKETNNPFALIQEKPGSWKGLTGSKPNGFLIFENQMYGIRAGFINLVQTYLNRGLNTISKIMPVYAPAGHGANDPAVYITLVENKTGIDRNTKISTPEQIMKVGRAIVQVEEGSFWVNEKDFIDGFNAAMRYTKLDQVVEEVKKKSGGSRP